jgi:hypothetical protein
MTNPKGRQHETASVKWLRANGWPYAKVVAKEGRYDRGDVALGDGIAVTIECKNEKSIDLAGGQRELAEEMRNNGHRWGFALHKKRGTTNIGEHYAVLPVAVLMDILAAALRAPELEAAPVRRKRVIPRLERD